MITFSADWRVLPSLGEVTPIFVDSIPRVYGTHRLMLGVEETRLTYRADTHYRIAQHLPRRGPRVYPTGDDKANRLNVQS
jgi:hypothetical protein